MQNNANEMAVFNTAIYVRLSKEDIVAAQSGRESNSITNQKQLILDFLKDKPEFNIVSIRIDDGYTGTNFDRPAFQRMLNDIKAGRINCVVVKDLSRFGREYINSGKYIHRLFPVLGVRLIAINDNIDTITRDESSEFIGWWLYEAPDAGYTVSWEEAGKEVSVDLTEAGALEVKKSGCEFLIYKQNDDNLNRNQRKIEYNKTNTQK